MKRKHLPSYVMPCFRLRIPLNTMISSPDYTRIYHDVHKKYLNIMYLVADNINLVIIENSSTQHRIM